LLIAMLLLMVLNLPSLVWSHGGLVWPPPWQDGDHLGLEETYTFIMRHYPVQRDAKTGRVITNIWSWLTDQAYLGGHGTDEHKGGAGVVTNFKEGGCNHICQENKVPWSAPGQAPVFGGGCGVFGGNPHGCRREAVDLTTGETVVTARTYADPRPPGSPCLGGGTTFTQGPDARDVEFPQAAKTGWLVGSVQEVAWVSQAGHQGGYTYRLCHLGSKGPAGLEENCFRNNILPFASNTTMVRLVGRENLGSWQEWPQTDITVGTHPPGSAWRPAGIYRKGEVYIRKDKVLVPDHLIPGDYVLSFRWDGATVGGQVWQSCSNVRLVQALPPPPIREL